MININIEKLPKRIKYFHDESLPSYIVRFASANHFESPLSVFQTADLTMPGLNHKIACTTVLDSTYDVDKLSMLTGQTRDSLMQLTYGVSEKIGERLVRDGISIPENTIQKRKSKFCPKCLDEGVPYFKKIWELTFYTTCEKHAIVLVDCCPSCRRPISWENRNKLDYCICGTDFKKVLAATASNIVIDYSEYIFYNFQENSTYLNQQECTNPLYDIKLRESLFLITFMCGQVQKQYFTKEKQWNSNFGINLSNEELYNLLLHVLCIFSDWPVNYHKFLGEFRTSGQHHTGIKKSFGYFYNSLYTKFMDDSYNFMIEEFEDYIANSWSNGSLSNRVQKIKVGQKKINGRQAAEILGIKVANIKKMIENGELKGVIKKRTHHDFILVEEDSVISRLNVIYDAMTLDEVVALLCIGPRAVYSILKSECIQLIKDCPQVEYLFDRRTVYHLLDVFDQETVVETIGAEEKLNTFGQLINGYNVGQIIKLVMDRKLRPCGKQEGEGLQKYIFRVADKKSALRLLRQDSWLTLKEVSKEIRVRRNTAAQWIRKGFMQYEVINGKFKIKPEYVQLFQETYITLGEICDLTGNSRKKIVKDLSTNGVIAKAGQSIDGEKGYLYLRSEVLSVLNVLYA